MRVTSKGQVTIPRDLRDLVGITPNSDVIFSIENGKLTLAPKSGKSGIPDAERLKQVLDVLDRLEGTGDPTVDAETLMSMTRDR